MKYTGKVNLLKFQNAFAANVKGKNATKRCICIPIEDNHFYVGEKSVYFDFICREISEEKRKDNLTHVIAPSLPKEVYEAMSDEERKSVPILGNLKEYAVNTVTQNVEVTDDDLPF